eukprot:jgi/Botrbrau1/18458/Bobra.0072s0041.1
MAVDTVMAFEFGHGEVSEGLAHRQALDGVTIELGSRKGSTIPSRKSFRLSKVSLEQKERHRGTDDP